MKKFFGIILCITLVLGFAGCNIQPRMGAGNLVIATSGDYELLLRDFLYFVGEGRSQTESQLEQLGFFDFDEYWTDIIDEETGRVVFDELKEHALNQAKMSFTLYMYARSLGYSYDPEVIAEIQEAVNNAVLSFNLPTRTGERGFYETNYVTAAEIVETFKMLSTTDVFQASLRDAQSASDTEVLNFYNDPENAAMVESLRGITVAHILVTFDEEAEDEEANREEVAALAESILARLEAGENFGELVRAYSGDIASVEDEGQYYISTATNFVPEFMEWVFLIAEEGDFGIVETGHGLHIMHLVRRDTFEDMQTSRFLPIDGYELPALRDVIEHQSFLTEMDAILASIEREWVVNEDLFNRVGFDVYARQR